MCFIQASSAFSKLGVRLIALSVDSADSHGKWKEDIKAYAHVDVCFMISFPELPSLYVLQFQRVDFPIIADEKRELCTLLGMVDPDEKDSKVGFCYSLHWVTGSLLLSQIQ